MLALYLAAQGLQDQERCSTLPALLPVFFSQQDRLCIARPHFTALQQTTSAPTCGGANPPCPTDLESSPTQPPSRCPTKGHPTTNGAWHPVFLVLRGVLPSLPMCPFPKMQGIPKGQCGCCVAMKHGAESLESHVQFSIRVSWRR